MRLPKTLSEVAVMSALALPACVAQPKLEQLTCDQIREKIAILDKKNCRGPNPIGAMACLNEIKLIKAEAEKSLKDKNCE